MKFVCKSAYYDRELHRTVMVDEVIDVTKARAEAINGTYPGTLEQETPRKRTTSKK